VHIGEEALLRRIRNREVLLPAWTFYRSFTRNLRCWFEVIVNPLIICERLPGVD